MQRKESMETEIYNQKTTENCDKKCCGCWENSARTSKEDDCMKCESCRN